MMEQSTVLWLIHGEKFSRWHFQGREPASLGGKVRDRDLEALAWNLNKSTRYTP